jgi:DeoR family ulaG and ulaABCDEF operon transcriptional repressor
LPITLVASLVVMLEAERHRLILAPAGALHHQHTELVEIVGASDATIRRDVTALAESGQFRRVRGGAEAVHPRHEAHLVGVPLRSVARSPCRRGRARRGGTDPGRRGHQHQRRHRRRRRWWNSSRASSTSSPTHPDHHAVARHQPQPRLRAGGTIFREQNIVLSPFDND